MKGTTMMAAAGIAATLNAAVPVAWTNSPGMGPYPVRPVPHGSTVDFAVTLEGYSDPPVAPGADVRLWYQTNGMGQAWWSAPATIEGGTITATFGPAQDCGADRVSLFFGAPSNVYASAVLRLTHAPGFRPNEVEPPVHRLDFAGIEVANAPWPAEIAAAVAPVAAAAANAASVAANAAASASAANENFALCATKAELNAHASNTNIHVTAAQQAAWNAKQDALPLETGTGASSVKLKVSGNGATTAGGNRAVALGYAAKATGHNAVAANNQTTASGENSAAIGYKTMATNNAELAAGVLNNPHNGTRFSVGIGVNATAARTNAVEVMANGDVYVRGVGGYTGGERTIPADGARTLQKEVAAIREDMRGVAAATNDFLRTTGGTMRGDLRFRYFDDVGVAIGAYHPGALDFSSNYPEYEGITAVLDVSRIPIDEWGYGQDDIAFLSDIPDVEGYATTGDLAALAAEVAPAVAAYPRVYSFMTGATNANFVVTNYQLTAEADAGRTHFDPADPDLDFSTVPSSLRLEDFSSGTNRVVCDTRDWTVWYFACKIGGAINTAFTNAVATCRAWCGFTATGLENPVPDTLIVDVPNIWLMAGKTFEKHVAGTNSCWVIRSKDTVVPISDNSQSAGGFLELTDAFGEPYIRFNKSESYFIDPKADGIEYDAATGAWCVSYPTQNKPKGGANAVLEGSATYPGKAVLKDEDDPDCPATITWTGSAGAWVMNAVPKAVGGVVPSQMFFGAVIEVEGQDYIEYLRPMSIPHLLVDGVKIAPVVPASHPAGTTVTWKVVE